MRSAGPNDFDDDLNTAAYEVPDDLPGVTETDKALTDKIALIFTIAFAVIAFACMVSGGVWIIASIWKEIFA